MLYVKHMEKYLTEDNKYLSDLAELLDNSILDTDDAKIVRIKDDLIYEFCSLCGSKKMKLPPPYGENKVIKWFKKIFLGKPYIRHRNFDFERRQIHTIDYKLNSPKVVLIVDDSPEDIVKTFKSIGGIKNLKIKIFHVRRSETECGIPKIYENCVREILEYNPDIVLMDYNLGFLAPHSKNFTGDVIVEKIKATTEKVLFVANTMGDGGASSLEKIGCLKNISKGYDLSGLKIALSIL